MPLIVVMMWLAFGQGAPAPVIDGRLGEFQIRLADVGTPGIAYLSTAEPMAVSYWPASMDDDCRSVRLPQGFLPERAEFHPESWQRVSRK